jgi:hypothetical protein
VTYRNSNTTSPSTASRTVTFSVSDGALTGSATATISVSATNRPPVIDSNGGGDAATFAVPENTTNIIATVHATDPDGTTPSYAIVGGVDSAKFTINSATGELAFIAAPDFENPGDSGGDNSYVVQVAASDGSLTDVQTITVNVTNVVEETLATWIVSKNTISSFSIPHLLANDANPANDGLRVVSVASVNLSTSVDQYGNITIGSQTLGNTDEFGYKGALTYTLSDGSTNSVNIAAVNADNGENLSGRTYGPHI